MKTRYTSLFLVFALFCYGATSSAQEKNTHYLAAVELVSTIQEDNFSGVMEASAEMMAKAFPQNQQAIFKASMKEFMGKYFTWDVMKDSYAKVYMALFTESELKEISSFYKTPAGTKLREKTAEIITLSSATGQQVLKDHMADFTEIMKKHMALGK